MKNIILFSLLVFFSISIANAQRGKDGSKTVVGTEIVNAYTSLTANASVGDASITVNNSNLSSHFTGNLSAGDLIMIIQMQGVFVEDTTSVITADDSNRNPTWGRIISYRDCGNYEFVQVESVPNATTINLDCSLSFDYTSSGNVVVLRVPRYASLSVPAGTNLTVDPWDGTTGGILAIEVNGTTTVNGSIDVSDLGFRGGQPDLPSISGNRYSSNNPLEGAEKGEGIAGDVVFYDDSLSGRYTRGAAANAGGGGNGENAGGGGGSNAGDILNWENGIGIPDPTYNGVNAPWDLETPSIDSKNTSGGGRGGYSHTSGGGNELNDGPGDPAWGGDGREEKGGLGGRPLDYSTGKIFMGGGGGSGEGNSSTLIAGAGGNGGGIVFISSYGNVTGTGNITANGQDGFDCGTTAAAPIFTVTGKDAAGGAGGGGTVIIKTTGTVSNVTIDANGGNGGNQYLRAGFGASLSEAEGPGGGGGGGYIAITTGTPTRNTSGGVNGTSDSPLISNFPPNGATGGGTGLPNESINAFDYSISGTISICTNDSTVLTATINGTAPIGASIEWYDAATGGTLLFTGAAYTTPNLSTNATYYVRVCPAPYRVPVTVTVSPCSAITANFSASDSTICLGDCIDFTDLSTGSTATSWTWYFPNSDSATSNQQNPTNICYNTAGSFDVALVVSDGVTTDSLHLPNFIIVNPLPTVIANATVNPICSGDTVSLYGSGASSYTWDNSVTNGTVFNPTSTLTYTVTGTDSNGCTDTNSITLTVNNCTLPTASFTTSTDSICVGDSITFTDNSTGTNISVWTWTFPNGTPNTSNTQGPHTIVFTTPGPQNINLFITDANGTDDTTITIQVNPLPTVIAGIDTTICSGDQVNLNASGAISYVWDNALGNGQFQTPSPTANTTYLVTGTDANGCVNTDTTAVTVISCTAPVALFNTSSTSICIDDCINFNDIGTGGTPTSWSWHFFGANPTTSNNQNPTNICYDSIGTFDVALFVANAYGNDSIFLSNYITVDSCNVTPTVVTIPNVFSPNGDGQNDLFQVTGSGITSVTINIYNRWGNLLFNSAGITNKGWGGRTSAGTECLEGTYFYFITIEGLTVEKNTYKGSVTLLR